MFSNERRKKVLTDIKPRHENISRRAIRKAQVCRRTGERGEKDERSEMSHLFTKGCRGRVQKPEG